MLIMAIDLGTKSGWAIGSTSNILFGSIDCSIDPQFEGGGIRYLKFRRAINEMFLTYKPDYIVYEAVQGHRSTYSAQIYGSYKSHLQALAEEYSIPYEGVHSGTLKKYATGKGNASKDQMKKACRDKLGVIPNNDDEADAIWLLSYAMKENKIKWPKN
jgi:Holliday junction resolvasome RuvABC endonuclease subunit